MKRGKVQKVIGKVGVGKESDIYKCLTPEGEIIILKLARYYLTHPLSEITYWKDSEESLSELSKTSVTTFKTERIITGSISLDSQVSRSLRSWSSSIRYHL